MQIRYDRRSGSCNLRLQMNPKKQKTNSGLQRIHGLCVSAAVFDHLSYEDPYIWSRPICWVHLNPWKEWNMKMMCTAEVQGSGNLINCNEPEKKPVCRLNSSVNVIFDRSPFFTSKMSPLSFAWLKLATILAMHLYPQFHWFASWVHHTYAVT